VIDPRVEHDGVEPLDDETLYEARFRLSIELHELKAAIAASLQPWQRKLLRRWLDD
jgi:hypothetical protein